MTDALDRLDLLDLDDDLSDDNRLLRDTVRKFADDRLRPNIREWFESGTLPARELAQEFGELGVLGMHLYGYGCQGATAAQYGLVCAEIEAVDSGLRSLVSVQGSLAMYAIYAYGSEEQKQRWLPGMAAGEAVGCFGLTEPDSGSDPGSMRTRAVRDGSDWVLTGTRCGSRTALSPTSPWCGLAPTTASAASSSSRACPASRPGRAPQDLAARVGDELTAPRRGPATGRRAAA